MAKNPYPSDTQDRYIVRFPEGMRDRIAAVAKENGRSMNAELVARIERSLEADTLGFSKDLLDVVALQATLTATFCRTLDWSKLDDSEAKVLQMLADVSERIVSRLHLAKNGDHIVAADTRPDTAT